jgi:hypothetical protein
VARFFRFLHADLLTVPFRLGVGSVTTPRMSAPLSLVTENSQGRGYVSLVALDQVFVGCCLFVTMFTPLRPFASIASAPRRSVLLCRRVSRAGTAPRKSVLSATRPPQEPPQRRPARSWRRSGLVGRKPDAGVRAERSLPERSKSVARQPRWPAQRDTDDFRGLIAGAAAI